MSISLDPGQARHFIRPDLVPNCLQKLSADDTSRQRVNHKLEDMKVLKRSPGTGSQDLHNVKLGQGQPRLNT